ncbi:MAG: VWA domain-containing protein [Xanthomonadales bacterium]|nr:VWA domain-containing protein [Gammaproteobacteria bacterium]MBT8054218.1 VWA domain-containing protein [Gammaproteobacteria bacterium]NNK51313.1 VWA domain-containing protein [Xanthomonadales bacterium]
MNAFDTLHFIRPLWLFLLPLAVFLPWLWKRTRRPAGDWARVCDPHLLRWLSVRQVTEKEKPRNYVLASLALFLVILALAGPSWQKLQDTSFSARDARVIVMDLSRSMLAGDLRPDRLTQARFRLADLLASTEEGQVGLVSYAGDAYVVSPLTSDMNTVANLLPALRPDIIPVAGSRADIALDMAASLLERAGLSRGEILLVTDSARSRDAAKARELRDRGIFTSVVAVGTPDGAPIPSGGGFVSDRSGNVVIARMDRSDLQSVAGAGGGKYTELGAETTASSLWLEREGSEFSRRDDALGERWKDAGPWLVLLLLPLALAGFRKGLFFMVPLVLANGLLIPRDVSAGWWADVWQTRDQQAFQALVDEDAEKAAALAKDPALSGEAWYRSGEYTNALDAWTADESADANYNRGNALAHMGELDAAIAAYDQALAIDPEMADALHNRALVEKMKEQEQQQEEGGEGESQDGESSSGEQDAEPSESEEGEQDETGEAGEPEESEQEGEPQQGEQGEQEPGQQLEPAEAWSEEDAQAMEQWLRRIPDDPGGLLRRKFRNQHQRRGAPEDETESW